MLMEKAEAIANSRTPEIVAQARKEMSAQLEYEIARLKELQKVNRAVRAEEIELLVEQHRALDQHLADARLRLDAIRQAAVKQLKAGRCIWSVERQGLGM